MFVFFIQQGSLINHTFADFKSPKVVREVKILFLFFFKNRLFTSVRMLSSVNWWFALPCQVTRL